MDTEVARTLAYSDAFEKNILIFYMQRKKIIRELGFFQKNIPFEKPKKLIQSLYFGLTGLLSVTNLRRFTVWYSGEIRR